MSNTKDKIITNHQSHVSWLLAHLKRLSLFLLAFIALGASALIAYDKRYEGKIYPGVSIDGIPFGGKTPGDVEEYWRQKNIPFDSKKIEFTWETHIATVSGKDFGLGYDEKFSAIQAYLVGRSKYPISNFITKFITRNTDLKPYFQWDEQVLDETLSLASQSIDIPVQEALFEFSKGKVTQFKPSREGKKVNIEKAKKQFAKILPTLPTIPDTTIHLELPIDTILPSITTDRANAFGIKELIGVGYSEFVHSIPGRVHNIALAAFRIHGILVKPGDTFSFNQTVGDISAATGYQAAYIIQNGRTVLGDGGGVCQVSTTLFRAILNAGLPVVERRAHAYRVQYYEQAGFKAGLDATVFAPSVDLKFKNDTGNYILIQAKTDTKNMSLTIELYGTNDGRKAEIVNHQVWDITPPPPALYQDDPTLPKGGEKQVDFPAWGAKAAFTYVVRRDGEAIQNETFLSNFRPWQAVYLRGTKE